MVTLSQQRAGLSRALGPLVTWIDREPSLRNLDVATRSDLLWNLFTAGVSRTQSAESFPLVTGDENQWNDLVNTIVPNTVHSSTAADSPSTSHGIWHLQILLVGLVSLAVDPWMPSDRWRFYTTALGTFLVACAGMLWTFGWTKGPWRLGSGRVATFRPSEHTTPWVNDVAGGLPTLEPIYESVQPSAPPPGVPPVPLLEQQVGPQSAVEMSNSAGWSVGQRCVLLAIPPYTSLAGQCGQVTKSDNGTYTVQLDNGLNLTDVPSVALSRIRNGPETSAVTSGAPESALSANATVFAPYAGLGGGTTKLQLQAARLKDSLTKAHGLAANTPQWGGLFWQAVKNEKDIYGIEPEIGNLLQSHGYIGDGTIGPPRAEELKRALQEVETLGAPAHGSGGTFARVADIGQGDNPEQMAWHLKLPADLQRAAPELYRNIRAEGVSSVRQWVNDQHPSLEMKQSSTYQDLFSAATIIDFELADCKSEAAVMHKLGTSDSLEIQLRKLGAHVYFRRTKDKFGASRMLGVRAPGSQSDIAPKWLLDEANLHSKVEWQRTERGQKMSRHEHTEGGPKTKFAGKFRGRGGGGKGGGRGKGGANTPPKTQG